MLLLILWFECGYVLVKFLMKKYIVFFSNIIFFWILEEFWFVLFFFFKKSGVKIFLFFIVVFVVCLVGGLLSLIGCVEVFYFGEWGIVCDDWWIIKDGYVVCWMLNFLKVVELFYGLIFGGGFGLLIWLMKFICNGIENLLFECKNVMKYLGIIGCFYV